MYGDNFVSFFTVQGFFVGIIFGILKSFDAEGLFIYTSLITVFFYLFSHIIAALYFRTITSKATFFPRDSHERKLDIFVQEINKREKIVDSASKMTDLVAKINQENQDRKEL